jgi:cysteine desulfurase
MSPAVVDDATTYLDYAATAPVRPEVVEAMAPFWGREFGNPSGSHRVARSARTALEDSREEIASLLGAHPDEVIFTGGGTEADNLAVLGVLAARDGSGPVDVAASAIEHAAVREPLRAAACGAGALFGVGAIRAREIAVTETGVVDVEALEELLGPTTALVSVMAANNEVGTIQPLEQICRLVADRAPAAAVHTDAVQAARYVDVSRDAAACHLISLSAHKLGGPKGVGALVVRPPVSLAPVVFGGGQERDRRSGTHNVAGIVGFAAALRATVAGRAAEAPRVAELRDRLADGLLSAVPGAIESAPRERILPGHCHLRFVGIEQEELLVLLDQEGLCASGGSACASGALEPSHVLAAMGVPDDEARGALRLTLGYGTTSSDVARALDVIPAAVRALRF